MNNVLKQRLVGALILVALGVVFWPIIFVEPDKAPQAPAVRMPPPPEIDTSPLPSPDKVGLRGSPPLVVEAVEDASPNNPAQDPISEIADPNAADLQQEEVADDAAADPAPPVVAPAAEPAIAERTRDERPAQPEIDDHGIPVAWTLQVISVSRKDSADQTRQRLEGMGHKAYIKVAEVEGRKLYRVYVGPKFEQARLDDIKTDIDRQFGVKSMVRRYYP